MKGASSRLWAISLGLSVGLIFAVTSVIVILRDAKADWSKPVLGPGAWVAYWLRFSPRSLEFAVAGLVLNVAIWWAVFYVGLKLLRRLRRPREDR